MKIARLPSKRKNIIIIIILVIGLPLLTYAAYQVVQLVTNASADNEPKNIILSNLTTSSAVISWTTDSSTRGTVSIVKSGTEGSPILDKRGNDKRFTHYVELTSLEPNTTYSFVITSGDTKYTTANNKSFTFKTAPISATTPTPNPIHGTVDGVSGDDVIVFAMLKDKSGYPVSTTMPSGGNWIMDLSTIRSVAEKALVISNANTNLVVLAISGTEKGSFIKGSYSELFDSNGKLNSTQVLSLKSDTTLYSYFPTVAKFEVEETQDTTEETPTEETPTEEEPTTDDKTIKLVKDLEWIDMVTTTSNGWTSGASTIRITNLTDTGFTVIWVSASSEQGYVNYGTSSSSLSSEAIDERDSVAKKGTYYVHSVSLTKLQPETKYYYEVISGKSTYDNSGKKYSVTTFKTLSSAPAYVSITGSTSNMPASNEAIIVAQIKDTDSTGSSGNSGYISTVVGDNGKWLLSVADSRTSDGSAYFEYTSSDKMYFSALSTTSNPEELSVSMSKISDDVTVTLPNATSTTVVKKLSNYGVI